MGYFSNGTEGDMYEAQYCHRCVHEDHERGCAVMLAHVLHNYEECNNEGSILHLLIPRRDDGFNDQCRLFWERGKGGGGQPEPIPVPLTVVKAA